MSKLGNLIRTLRTENKMTQADLAARLHVTDKAVSKWERDLSFPDISLLPRLAEIFNIPVSDILGAIDDKGDPARITEVYRLSHDICTPLHIIIGCTDLAEKYGDDPENRKRYLEVIKLSGLYLLEKLDEVCRPVSGCEAHNKADLDEYYRLYIQGVDLDDYYCMHVREDLLNQYSFIGKRFLVVDDKELNRGIVAELIRAAGAYVDFADNGAVCLDKLASEPAGHYDLILMDISMPVMDGIEAAKRIRTLDDPGKAEIPIVVMSVKLSDNERQVAVDAGINAFSEKPINTGSLYSIISELLK